MHDFKVGDRVRFIDKDDWYRLYGQERIVKRVFGDEIYVDNERGDEVYYLSRRFELVNTAKAKCFLPDELFEI